MKKILSLMLMLNTFLYSQNFYNVELDPTGVSQLTIFQAAITSLEPGDEIGIFDENALLNFGDCSSTIGPALVGAGVWSGEQLEIVSVGSVDNCAFGGFQLPGYQTGNEVIIKVYRDGLEYNATATYSAGTGTFGDLFMAISSLELEQLDPPYYNVDLAWTGASQLTILQSSIANLQTGDEIGIFDENALLNFGDCSSTIGPALVGAGVWSGEQLEIVSIGSVDNCAFGGSQLAGYQEGNPIIIKVYRESEGLEYGAMATYSAGTGTFGDLFMAISELTLDGGDLYGCTDSSACNYNPEATADDGSCAYEVDCAGECGGSAVEDCAGVCNGDNICGCMDEEALNYDSEVTYDDGSCDYPASSPEDFVFNQSTLQAFYFIVDATFEGEPLELGQDWIAVYNGDICVGARLWTGEYTDIPAMGDDGAEYTAGYMSTGDNPSFKVYDASSGEIYSANITHSEDIAWENNGFLYIDQLNAVLISTTSYSLDLHYGANLVSFYALPEDASIGNVMLSLDGFVSGVIGEGVAASPNPVLGWVGSLNVIDPLSGYWVIVNSSSSLDIVDGLYTDTNSIYDLHFGANLISFPGEFPVALSDALQGDFVSNITGIIGEGVAATPNPVLGWVGSLNEFVGGDGYWMKVDEALSFSFSIPASRNLLEENVVIEDSFSFNQSSKQAFYFIENLYIPSGLSINEDDWFLAYNDGLLVGSRQWNGQYTDIPVMGYDGNSYSFGYCEPGDIPQIKLYKNSTGEIIDLTGQIPSWQNNQIYMLNDIELGSYSEINPLSFGLVKNYPNPFNPITTIDFNLDVNSDITLAVYDISGKLVKEIVNDYMEAGYYSIDWNGKNNNNLEVSSGTYICKLISNNSSDQIKLLLIK